MGDGGRPLWHTVVSTVFGLLLVLATLPVIISAVRDKGSARNTLLQRDRSRTRRVSRDLRNGRDLEAVDLPLAQAVLDGTRLSSRLVVVMVLLSASSAFTGATVGDSLPWLSYGAAVVALLVGVFGFVTTRAIHRGGARIGLRPGGGDP
ncbi:MAG: hypothetical protein M3Y71_11420 [Actinomycetota bacterium]|nr:hypothetical protein [Actinomycetota bacterium]